MSALGLPQTRLRGRDVGFREAALFRRRRIIALALLAVLCLCITMSWRLFRHLPPSAEDWQRSLTNAQEIQQQPAVKIKSNPTETSKRVETRSFRDEKQIVVVVNHFRDSEACAQTIVEARKLAFLASRIHFRVFEELYLAREQTCVQRFCELEPGHCKELQRSAQLRTQRRDASGALGTTVAKYVAEGMVEREKFADDFYLSVEPGVVVFTDNWDIALLKQWYSIGNDKAILSVAPKSLELRGLTNDTILVQCSARINSKSPDAVVEFNAPEPVLRSGNVLLAPVLQTQYSEVFHFGPTRALFAVRSDPYTPLISTGHEYARATRFWTRGYDFYAPNQDIFFARYKWQEPPLPLPAGGLDDNTEQLRQSASDKSNRRIRQLLGLSVSAQDGVLEQREAYGVGTARSMEAWQKFSGVDPHAAFDESTTNQFSLCANVASGKVHYISY